MINNLKIYLLASILIIYSSIVAQSTGRVMPTGLDVVGPQEILSPDQRPGNETLRRAFGEKAGLLPQNPLDGLPFTVTPYGFVKTDYYWDSRQVVGFREDQALLWPRKKLEDPCGRDINARANFQFSAIQTRIGFFIKGPNIGKEKNIKARAVIEADYFGLNENLINQMRLRHAFFQLDFEKYNASLLFGQFWHPLFQPDCFIRELSFNFGIPFDTVSRQPQIRYAQKFAQGSFVLAALSQRDFQSFGPLGFNTSYIRNSRTPNICADFRWYLANGNFVGTSFDGKRLAPRIVSPTGYAVKEYVNSFIGQCYASISLNDLTINAKAIYAQNGTDFSLISGYAVKSIAPITDCRTYTPTSCFSVWADTFYVADYGQHKFQLEYALFVGGSKNLGTNQALVIDPLLGTPIVYAIDPSIAYVWRVAPRLLFKRYPVRFGIECISTGAAFGTLNNHAKPVNASAVKDFRFLFVAYYVF